MIVRAPAGEGEAARGWKRIELVARLVVVLVDRELGPSLPWHSVIVSRQTKQTGIGAGSYRSNSPMSAW